MAPLMVFRLSSRVKVLELLSVDPKMKPLGLAVPVALAKLMGTPARVEDPTKVAVKVTVTPPSVAVPEVPLFPVPGTDSTYPVWVVLTSPVAPLFQMLDSKEMVIACNPGVKTDDSARERTKFWRVIIC